MSRIGSQPIEIKDGVTINIVGQEISVKGPKGELNRIIDHEIGIEQKDKQILVTKKHNGKVARQKWGLSRSLISNMVEGVTEGFQKVLNINGVGYKAQVQGQFLTLSLGYSHDIKFFINDDIAVKCPKPTIVEIVSHDKEALGQAAAVIRSLRKPEPYKGKGVKYEDEFIFRKEGKK
jgi:large subunit ribosomal protein L6